MSFSNATYTKLAFLSSVPSARGDVRGRGLCQPPLNLPPKPHSLPPYPHSWLLQIPLMLHQFLPLCCQKLQPQKSQYQLFHPHKKQPNAFLTSNPEEKYFQCLKKKHILQFWIVKVWLKTNQITYVKFFFSCIWMQNIFLLWEKWRGGPFFWTFWETQKFWIIFTVISKYFVKILLRELASNFLGDFQGEDFLKKRESWKQNFRKLSSHKV